MFRTRSLTISTGGPQPPFYPSPKSNLFEPGGMAAYIRQPTSAVGHFEPSYSPVLYSLLGKGTWARGSKGKKVSWGGVEGVLEILNDTTAKIKIQNGRMNRPKSCLKQIILPSFDFVFLNLDFFSIIFLMIQYYFCDTFKIKKCFLQNYK
jgi:hypothetical protein